MNMEKGERGDGEHSIIQVAGDTSNPEAAAATNGDGEEISPLLGQPHKPRMTIFSVSYPKRKPPTESTLKDVEIDVALSNQFILWIWSGSRYSGLVCMALSSIIYFFMEVLLDIFSVGTIPLFEIVFTRCAIILILSFMWMKKIGQPVFGPAHIRKLLVARALTGFISMLSFIYSIQSLPLPNAIVLSFTTPIMASIVARVILHEKLTIKDIAGLVCSIFGLLFIFQPMLVMREGYTKTGEPSNTRVVRGNHPVYAVLVGLFSSATSGISYCLIRAGGKASDQPIVRLGVIQVVLGERFHLHLLLQAISPIVEVKSLRKISRFLSLSYKVSFGGFHLKSKLRQKVLELINLHQGSQFSPLAYLLLLLQQYVLLPLRNLSCRIFIHFFQWFYLVCWRF